ncbi:mycothiol conjugate amidase Mca [Micromonospora sp. FIMYZ51]|uniref:mycothiol conjugate amidase Mca n=1 Tax=Micromonospora sp. FIMYZ51 TaxID=3051832 RepID=UPI00311FDBA7
MTARLRLMAVHAHPDDEATKGGATTARYAAEGVEVLVVTCTNGERGEVLNPLLDRLAPGVDMAAVRRAEMAAASRALGVRHAWLGFVDSGLPEGDPAPALPEGCFAAMDPEVAAMPLIRLMREFRPHVVTTYDEEGGYPHPDHVMCHTISRLAFDTAGDAARHAELGPPWQPLKLYYHARRTRARMAALHEGMLEAGLESPFAGWLLEKGRRYDRGERTTTRVECATYFPARNEAMRAHATQIAPDSLWCCAPVKVEQRAWPTEEFELVHSLVETSVPESDLFAGVRWQLHASMVEATPASSARSTAEAQVERSAATAGAPTTVPAGMSGSKP